MEKLVYQPKKRDLLILEAFYGEKQRVGIIVNGKFMKLSLKRAKLLKNIQCLYILSQVEELEELMELLRSEKGCPWDKEQTHESLLKYLIEEAYEYCDAVAEGDINKILEELGDLLLQVVFHCQIAKEKKQFDLNKCAETIKNKLIFRHPHVFKGYPVKDSKDVESIWKSQKDKEKSSVQKKG
ncbi:MazG family protein [Anaerobranca californiensis DSM 14826]|jgi:uncharacterized protein YabN with tetrapyrrole methylase and pyrophosphatase domain|uniref:MazG family protein n=1 Tax=Anaerobranca californiensis DSM 14826 TaxID=1120989 RepID=A0A1M6PIA0_9FIRM|nr:MazG nucleotide pyrophosphohydrolase domain-containing protein [Anaerobranca californiensis]SHK07662.1 MazG family protein [Anaerobranca californiensis DSM 14826]